MYIISLMLFLVLLYWAALEYLRRQWLAMPVAEQIVSNGEKQAFAQGSSDGFISLLVVARNEEQQLPRLFEALRAQSLSPDLFELHLVDDGSSDQTYALAQAFQAQARFKVVLHRLLIPKMGLSPKKAAITQVLPQTKGNLIVVTDADCVPDQHWLAYMQQLWQKQQPVFISGGVRYAGEQSLFEKMQALDFAALIGVGASMLAAGKPGMCNAANMAFSKKAFEAVGGYSGNELIPSGDDEFLLQKLAKAFPGRVVFLKSSAALVSTAACCSWQQFVQQRKRWAGKWRLHSGYATKLVAVGVFLFYLLLALSLFLPLFQPGLLYPLLLVLAVKALADYRFLKEILQFLRKPLSGKVFLLMEFVYPFYVLFFAVAANTGSFSWKDRSYSYSISGHE